MSEWLEGQFFDGRDLSLNLKSSHPSSVQQRLLAHQMIFLVLNGILSSVSCLSVSVLQTVAFWRGSLFTLFRTKKALTIPFCDLKIILIFYIFLVVSCRYLPCSCIPESLMVCQYPCCHLVLLFLPSAVSLRNDSACDRMQLSLVITRQWFHSFFLNLNVIKIF